MTRTERRAFFCACVLLTIADAGASMSLPGDRNRRWEAPPANAQRSIESPPAAQAQEGDQPLKVALKNPFTPPEKRGDYLDIDFRHLACFDIAVPEEPALQRNGERKRVPWEVQALDGMPVRIRGYMIPVNHDADGRTTEFVIVRSSMVCCYGQTPAPNEWVMVRMKGKGAFAIQDIPQYFYGRLHIGERYLNGVFVSLYQLDGEKVTLGE